MPSSARTQFAKEKKKMEKETLKREILFFISKSNSQRSTRLTEIYQHFRDEGVSSSEITAAKQELMKESKIGIIPPSPPFSESMVCLDKK